MLFKNLAGNPVLCTHDHDTGVALNLSAIRFASVSSGCSCAKIGLSLHPPPAGILLNLFKHRIKPDLSVDKYQCKDLAEAVTCKDLATPS